MRDPLNEFISQHRDALDAYEPSPELWIKIESKMTYTPVVNARSFNGLKYFGFGASVLLAAIVTYGLLKKSAPLPLVETTAQPAVIQPVKETKSAATDVFPESAPSARSAFTATYIPGNQTGEAHEAIMPATDLYRTETAAPGDIPQETTALPGNSSYSRTAGTNIAVDTAFTGITRIEISASSIDSEIKGAKQENLHIKGRLESNCRGKNPNCPVYTIAYRRQDTVLYVTVTLEYEKKNGRHTNSGSANTKGELFFTVPENTNVILHERYGNATVTGVHGKVCEVSCSSGSVALNDIGGSVKTNLTFGNFKARNISGSLFARISSGSATVDHVQGNADIATTFGGQTISSLQGNLVSRASSGTITITDMTGDADVTTTFGGIHLNGYKGTPELTASSGSISGKGITLTGNALMKTTFGGIEMTLANPLDALQFDLHTTFGSIAIDKNGQYIKKQDELRQGNGSILVKATSSSGSMVFK